MKKTKVLFCIALGLVLSSTAYADTFVAEQPLNTFTVSKHMNACWITDASQTTQYCEIAPNSQEFLKRLEIVNWYTDFDVVMRQKVYWEIVWDYGWTQDDYDYLWIESDAWEQAAYKYLSTYTNSYDSYAVGYLRDKSDDEDDFRDNVRDQLFVAIWKLENKVIWYNYINFARINFQNSGELAKNEDNQLIYLGNIDKIQDLMKSERYPNMQQREVDLYENIYFPNVKKFLELEKQWASFYRNYDHFDRDDFERFWYNSVETEKWLKGEYTNTFDTKVDFDEDLDQSVNGTAIETSVWNSYTPPVKTKIEIYQEKWNKDVNKDYDRVLTVIDAYVSKLVKKGNSSREINQKLDAVWNQLPKLIEKYEKSYNSATTTKTKSKYENYVWILLVLEKVLDENTF